MKIEITKQINLTKKDAVSSVFGKYNAQQHHDVYHVYYNFIKNTSPKRILEIGTAQGGFTQFLKYCVNDLKLNTDIRSYDIKDRNQYKDMNEMGIDVRIENIFDAEYTSCNPVVVDYIQREGTTLVLCDGGNKINEFRILAGYIKDGDFILAHDYAESKDVFHSKIKNIRWNWCEITNEDIIDVVNENRLEYFWKDIFENVVWTCRQKRKD